MNNLQSQTYANLYLNRVHSVKFVYISRTFQGLLIDFSTVFKDWKLMKNTDLHVKILLLKCLSPILKILVLKISV